MSPGEIRKLAEDCHRRAYGYGQTIERRIELSKESALLAYAAMVERCEKLNVKMIPHRRDLCDVCVHNGAKACKGFANCNFMRMTDDAQDETVAEIREDVSEYLTSIGPSEYPDETQFEEFADRFEAAHKREVEKLVKSFAKFERVSESLSLAKKQIEAEIADKSKVISELNEVRELNRRCCDENERLNGAVAKLSECLKDARRELCKACRDKGFKCKKSEPCMTALNIDIDLYNAMKGAKGVEAEGEKDEGK